MRAERRENRVVPRERGSDGFDAKRIAANDRERPPRCEFLRRSDKCGDLVAASPGQIEDLCADSSSRTDYKESHTLMTG